MRINTANSIATANTVHDRFGSWKAARESARFVNGKFVVESKSAPQPASQDGSHAGRSPK